MKQKGVTGLHKEGNIRKTLCLASLFLIVFLSASLAITGCSDKDKTDPNEIVLQEQIEDGNGAKADMASEEITAQEETSLPEENNNPLPEQLSDQTDGQDGVVNEQESTIDNKQEDPTGTDVQEDGLILVQFNKGVSTEKADSIIIGHGCEIVEKIYGQLYKVRVPHNKPESELHEEFRAEPSVKMTQDYIPPRTGDPGYEKGYIYVCFPLGTEESTIADVAGRHGCTVRETKVLSSSIYTEMKIPDGISEEAMVDEFLKEPLVLDAGIIGLAMPL
jgi:hypothetical protein